MNDWFEAEQRVERAQRLSESQRFEEALTEIDVALSINPSNHLWHAHRGFLLEELDRPEDAAEAYETAHRIEPADVEIAVALGATLARVAKYGQALDVFERIARLQPDLEASYCHRIGIYTELGRHDSAEEMFYLAQELNDSCPHCFFAIGSSLLARGQTERAIYCWKRVLEIEPDYLGVNRRIAHAYRAQDDHDQAREYFLREVRDDPGNTDLLFELAELAVASGELATAAARLVQILELDPDHVDAHFALGKIWLLRGQAERALACFEAISVVLGSGESFPGLNLKTGEALFQLGRFEDARKRLDRAADEDPGAAKVWTLLGDTFLALGKPDLAGDAFRKRLAMDADDATAHHKLAVCLYQMKHYDAGVEHCLSAIRLKPGFGMAMLTAVAGHLRLARWREARAMLRLALRHDPGSPELKRLSKQLWRYRLRHLLRQLTAPFRSGKSGSSE